MPEPRRAGSGLARIAACMLIAAAAGVVAEAAQETVTASQDSLLSDIEAALAVAQITIVEQAETDRFAIIYASRPNGGHVTITLARAPLEDTRITLAVATDSPRDEVFDGELLRALLQTQM